jgi:hypothetical protein
MSAITYELDESYIWHLEDERGRLRKDGRLEIPFYGKVEIEYDSEDDWDVVGISLHASNGKMGALCESWDVEIASTHPLWKPIERYLREIAIDDVFEAITQDIQSNFLDYQYQRGKDKARGLLY